MSQLSIPWPDTTDPGPQVGDGRPYTAAEWDQLWEAVYQSMGGATTGVLKGVWNTLAVTTPGANQISVNTGMAFGKGHIYWNTAALALAPASAAAGQTRKDSVILETDWDASGATEQYTTRIITKAGTSGAPPAMTQTDNSLWQVRLYDYTIDDAGAITAITDQRTYCRFATEVTAAMCVAGLLSADTTGRALMASSYFNAATVLLKFAAASFAADTSTRALFGDGIWLNAKLGSDCKRVVGELMENASASLGGSDGRRMVVGGVAYEAWVHCDGGASVNGVTIPDYRNKVLGGASSTNAAGTTGGADAADLSHTHAPGTFESETHRHTFSGTTSYLTGDERWEPGGVAGADIYHTHTYSGNTGYAGGAAITGASGTSGSATQDMRQATAYVYRFIYVG